MAEEVGGKPKKPFYKKWWFWVLAVLVVGAAASGSGGGGKSSDTAAAPSAGGGTSSAAASSDTAGTQAAKIGDPLKVGDLVFTVKSVKSTKKLTSPLGNKSGNWMVVTVNVKNGSKEAVTIDSSFFKLTEGDGTTYETDSDNLMYLDSEQNFFLEKINPKLDKTGKVLFAVPAGVKDAELQVQTGAFGTETGSIDLAK